MPNGVEEMYNDYTKSINIKHDYIRWPCVRVSSAKIPTVSVCGALLGCWYETWVFSDCPKIQTIQKTYNSKKKCLKAHKHIVKNLKKILEDKG